MMSEQFAALLKDLKGDMTYAEFSRKTGVDGGYMSRLISCERNIGINTLEQIVNNLGYNAELKFTPKNDEP
jgi:transcriptional regulator with XRE-family HTH domain